MHLTKQPETEPIPGYRLLEPLGTGGFGEVWKCQAPGGLFKAIKFVGGNGANSLFDGPCKSSEELRAIDRIKDIRHPFLLSMERVEHVGDDLVIVMELADRSLNDVLAECQDQGRAGLDRTELLGYLTEAAEVLDLMNGEYGLQHLDIKPRNLFLVRGHVKVADFGLVQSLGDVSESAAIRGVKKMNLSAVTPLYAAPELFNGAVSRHCDQYSLAIVFQELLTGQLPFNGKNVRQLMLGHMTEKPAIDPLPPGDRPVIARALSKDPGQRFASCSEFVHSLANGSSVRPVAGRPVSSRSRNGSAETKSNLSVASTQSLGPAEARVLPDYHFLNCLGRDPNAETWEAQTMEGKRKQVKFLYGTAASSRKQEQEALQQLQTLRHSALPALTVVSGSPGCRILVTDLVESNLKQRFQECQSHGERGVPRGELLNCLQSAAETLDQLYQQNGLQHLDLTPSRILLDGSKVFLGDFGMAQLLWLPSGVVSGRYSAPELSQRMITRSCDQYSLAIIYAEMLTGQHPFRGGASYTAKAAATESNGRGFSFGRLFGRGGREDSSDCGADVTALPAAERAVVARALHPSPEKRFETCIEFMNALRTAGGENVADRPGVRTAPKSLPLIAPLFEEARAWTLSENDASACEPEPNALDARFLASLPPAGAIKKFEGFCKQWDAQVVETAEASATFRIVRKSRSWLPWGKGGPAVDVMVSWSKPSAGVHTAPEVRTRVRPAPNSGSDAISLVQEIGPKVLESLQLCLLGNPERRNGERVLWPHIINVTYKAPNRPRSETVECQGKDLSLAGVGLYLTAPLPTSRVEVALTSAAHVAPVTVSGSVIRIQRWDEDLYEVGVLFD